MTDFARAFRITHPPDSNLQDPVWHGVQFPDGVCIVRMPFGGFHAATSFERLGEFIGLAGTVVEWADGGQP
jgi:hypothetical protein